MKKLNLLDILIFSFVVLFVYAASNKLMDYENFVAQLGKSPLIMDYAKYFAWFVPALEILISLLLLVPRTVIVGLFSFFFLMMTFTLYITFIMTVSPFVPCSCGGVLNNLGWTEHLIFNIVFTILPLIGIALVNKQKSKPELSTAMS